MERRPNVRRMLVCALVVAIVFLLSVAGLRPPAPLPASAPADQFSAARAIVFLDKLMGDEAPHPVGSATNQAVRGRIISELRKLGYAPDVQTEFECNAYGICATVNNVLARLDGAETNAAGSAESAVSSGEGAVLLAVHYDSVAAGPGASDDGVGIAAALEIARALKSLPKPRHSIIFLIDDGEEGGLLGARAFVDFHPWAKEVRAAVNMEARGTSGPSLMFETGSANDWAVRVYTSAAAHPAANSILYTAYQQLPNDTDFNVFKAAGYQGLNFAFIGDVVHYHTPLDNLANVDARSLQHQGDNALPSLLALANADFSSLRDKQVVYFDVFQQGVLRFSSEGELTLAFFSALLIAFEIARLFQRKRFNRRELLSGLVLCFMIVAATALLAMLLERFMRLGGALAVNWVAHPIPVEFAFWSLAIAIVVTFVILFGGRAGFWGLWGGAWSWWALLSLATAWASTGVSYVFVIPTGIAALAALPEVLRGGDEPAGNTGGIVAILPLAIAGILGFAPALLLYDGLGNRALPFIAAVVAFLLTAAAPLCIDLLNVQGSRGVAFFWAPIAMTIAAAFVVVVVPAYSANAPERVDIEYWQDADTGKSQWIVEPASGSLPESLQGFAMFERADKGPFPWERGPAYLAAASRLDVSAPTFTVLQSQRVGNRYHYRVLLRSERGAPSAMAVFPPDADVEEVRVNGRPVDNSGRRLQRMLGGWAVYRCLTMPAEGVEMNFTIPIGKPLEVYALDVSYGLPRGGESFVHARSPLGAPSQDGDVTIVSRHVQLNP